MFRFFPLLLLVVLVYNVVALGGPAGLGFSPNEVVDGQAVFSTYQFMEQKVFEVSMPSGSLWTLNYGDVFVVVGLLLLFFELIRATSSDGSAITNHALSLVLLVGCVIEFVVLPGFATSTFFILTAMALVDVVAGFIISISAARRDLSVTGGGALSGG